RQQLRRAQQAASLVDAENSVKVRQKEVEEAARILAEKEHELQQVTVRVQAAREQLVSESGKEEEREKARREVARLDDLTGKVQALAAARHQVSAAEQRLQEARRRQEETAAALAAVQNEVEKRTRAYVAVLERQAETGRLEGRYRELEQTGIRRKRLEEARQELAALRQAYDAVQEENRAVEQEYAGAREEAARLQETWARGQAAVLAATLVRGVPCPVCGSLEHPAPARSEAGLPAEEEVKAAQKRVEEAERLREEVRKRLGELVARKTALENRVQDLETELGENAGVDLAALRKAAREAKRLWIQAGQAAQEAKSLADEVQMLREKEKRARQDLEERDRVLRQAETAYEGMQAVLRERESEVPEEFRDQEVLAKARQGAAEKLTGMVAALEEARKAAEAAARELARAEAAASEARQALLKKRERAREEEADFYARLETTGCKDLPDYHAAKMPPAAIQALEVQLREFGESLFAARDRWRRAVEAAEGLVMPDLNQLSRVLQEARHNWQQAQTRHFELRAQLQTEGEWLQKLQANESLLQELETRYSVLGRLAEVASGKNRFGLNFQRFVLGALLDDVTTAATERLKLMSRGRYHLRRTLERTHARAAGGLELEVYDTYTGLERGVATLSGGESFLASLSLALGLADVVESYAGGVHLDTIFVDEGFGSLDPETLDFAMQALIDLQRTGRLVGIISHVPELKERIDARLEIKPVEKGSVASFRLN
ncbi:MAG: SMC family ATPase, partial [Syntrophomonadaceae bacterium]|nr:SMC family ATPase [Syntrophomonadaceae bacterium]